MTGIIILLVYVAIFIGAFLIVKNWCTTPATTSRP